MIVAGLCMAWLAHPGYSVGVVHGENQIPWAVLPKSQRCWQVSGAGRRRTWVISFDEQVWHARVDGGSGTEIPGYTWLAVPIPNNSFTRMTSMPYGTWNLCVQSHSQRPKCLICHQSHPWQGFAKPSERALLPQVSSYLAMVCLEIVGNRVSTNMAIPIRNMIINNQPSNFGLPWATLFSDTPKPTNKLQLSATHPNTSPTTGGASAADSSPSRFQSGGNCRPVAYAPDLIGFLAYVCYIYIHTHIMHLLYLMYVCVMVVVYGNHQ